MLELRATHGARFDDPAHRPRMAPGEGITGVAAASMRPVVIARDAHLDPRFMSFPNLPEDEYESILAVPVLARDKLAGALNVRTREPRVFGPDEIALLSAIAGQVGQAIENAKLYERSQQRVVELEALADIGRTLSGSLYLDDALSGIASRTVRALNADGCAVVLKTDEGCRSASARARPARTSELIAIAEAAPRAGRDLPGPAAAVEAAHHRRARGAVGGAALVVARGAVAADHHRPRGERRGRQRPGGTARAAGPGDPSPRQEQPPDGGLAPAAAGRRRPTTRHASKALEESVNRILSIAAVHDLLTADARGRRRLRRADRDGSRRCSARGSAAAACDSAARVGDALGRARDGARARVLRAVPKRGRARRRGDRGGPAPRRRGGRADGRGRGRRPAGRARRGAGPDDRPGARRRELARLARARPPGAGRRW